MPRYEYKCKKCGENFDVVHGINDKVDSCVSCGGEVRRVFHPVGIVFKGSGFYATDAKKPGNTVASGPGSEFKPDGDRQDGNGGGKKDEKKSEGSEKSDKKSGGK